MRKLIYVFALLVLLCNFTAGQDAAELAIIRSLLGVPTSTPVTSTSSAAIPKDKPLKVYVDVSGDKPERDKQVRDGIVTWFTDLSKSDAANPIELEIVADAGDAMIALIHFTDFPTEVVDPSGDDDGSRMGQPSGGGSYSSNVKMSMMVHTYIVIKEPGNLKLLYRRKVPVANYSTIVPGAQLTNAVTSKMRKEIDKEVDKRALKSKGEKDSKSPDIKLREEFAKWIASGGKPAKSE